MKKVVYIFLIIFCAIYNNLFSQNKTIDSLTLALNNAKHDTAKCLIIKALYNAETEPEKKIKHLQQSIQIAELNINNPKINSRQKMFFKYNYAANLNSIAKLYQIQGDVSNALKYYKSGLKNWEMLGDQKGIALSLNGIGVAHKNTGDFLKALESFNKSLKISEALNDKKGIAGALGNLGNIYKNRGDISKSLDCFNRSLTAFEDIGDKNGISKSLNSIGLIYKDKGDISEALKYFNKSLKLAEATNNQKTISEVLNDIGNVYHDRGDIEKALNHFNKCLKLSEASGDKNMTSIALTNIGVVYYQQGDLSLALEYYNKCLKIDEAQGRKKNISMSLNNIGIIYQDQGNAPKALEYYNKSLELRKEINDKKGIAESLNNLGVLYQHFGNPPGESFQKDAHTAGILSALDCFNKSLKIGEELGNKYSISSSLNNIGSIHLERGDFHSAIVCFNKSLLLSREIGFPERVQRASHGLFKAYRATDNHKRALENYELYIQMRDSINNESTRKASIKSQLKYEYEKQAAADSVAHAKESEIKNVQLQKQTAEIKAKKNQQYALFGGLGLVIIFAGFMFNRFKVTQKQKTIIEAQKEIVEEQKKLVEEKQKEILDSIHYARRIQMAQIPSEKQIAKTLERIKKL